MTSITDVSRVHLPPATALPGPVLLGGWAFGRRRLLGSLRRRHGSAFTMTMAPFGRCVVLTSADLTKELFTAKTGVTGNGTPNLGNVLGPGSTFALDGEPHRRRRKLLVPPFHGRQMRAHEQLMVDETRREASTWHLGVEMESTAPFMHLTLNIILRAVLGAEGTHLQRLRTIMPPMAELGAKITVSPFANPDRAWGAWARFRSMRKQYDEVVLDLISTTRRDPNLAERNDMLAMMIQSRYEDGGSMADLEIADELFTLLGAGHETTANTLSWAVERLRRHPALLDRLVEEVDSGGTELLAATVLEVQRLRPVITDVTRLVTAETMQLGQWVIPRGYQVLVAIDQVQLDENVFAEPHAFDPDRFVGAKAGMYSWIPFGGGTRRCIGAAFADMEMNVVLRTLLQDYELSPTTARSEKWRSRGVSWTPADGGRAVWHRRSPSFVTTGAEARSVGETRS
ncbi:hypothetical protein CH272_18690 [Rhodococcus sp. 05-340-1]|uniref:cytochrome P450 n=1 Tax=unclassified Rhodococcus (in: high G+C Gram-positive bacteria) TaxID=192944 RepID=UPI000B9B2139|nr:MULTISPECIES: cytochrome P450 [unclassified Rhodococcus (in: high G+C Gram-positive bacteria)]OZC87701.1 hypothetical protein CH254_14110 [Rhodococcus sp. 06-412-2C]OZC96352.1 hypothetical protein CH279_14280 [Rhodococcus sp. 06-412-2B]OZD65336.1 hypothetical protein CH271_20100 [Rhodococcus sp. 05-340-2]OZD74618.1 hypothetical protein CH272_18690 [Rhodococcus sp. 05-340-1]